MELHVAENYYTDLGRCEAAVRFIFYLSMSFDTMTALTVWRYVVVAGSEALSAIFTKPIAYQR
jgi:hypothetical protein